MEWEFITFPKRILTTVLWERRPGIRIVCAVIIYFLLLDAHLGSQPFPLSVEVDGIIAYILNLYEA